MDTRVTAPEQQRSVRRRLFRRRQRTRRERRLFWIALGLGLTTLISLAAVAAVLIYWDMYLLSPAGNPFDRGPFLTWIGQRSATLAWSLPGGQPVVLRAVSPQGQVVVARNGDFHGLQPGSRYTWTASIDGVGRASGSFQTAPLSLSHPVTFGVIGDYGSGKTQEWAVMRNVAAQNPAFVLSAGDNSYLISLPVLLDRNLFEPLHDVMANARLWATEGEHDLFLRNGYYTTQALHLPGSGGRYVTSYGPIQIVALGLQADSSAVGFARSALARPGFQARFILVHRPIQPGNPILPVLRRAHVVAIMCGHLHRYERRHVDGVDEFVVGTSGEGAGAPQFTRPDPDAAISLLNYGSLRVIISAHRVAYTYVDMAGNVLDRFARRLPIR
ncbi:MAG: metallophosphoesterase family protein [Gaiellales bacterium]